MNSSLKLLSLLSAAAVPAILAGELAGLQLPTAVTAGNAFELFVLSAVAMIAFADYSRTPTTHPRGVTLPLTATGNKAAHPLAA